MRYIIPEKPCYTFCIQNGKSPCNLLLGFAVFHRVIPLLALLWKMQIVKEK
jgi:hypothetical protein